MFVNPSLNTKIALRLKSKRVKQDAAITFVETAFENHDQD